MDRSLVYEDRDLIVVDKPSGLLTIRDPQGSPNLYSYLYEHVASERKRDQHLFIVHRLDRDTSGLLVFAKNMRTKLALQACFEEGTAQRLYEAVAAGTLLPVGRTERLVTWLLQDRQGNVFVVGPARGKRCVTFVTCVAQRKGLSYLDISLLTGRRNQIRLALADRGMPLLGDRKYGGPKAPRLFLNARVLSFPASLGLAQRTFALPRRFAFDPAAEKKR